MFRENIKNKLQKPTQQRTSSATESTAGLVFILDLTTLTFRQVININTINNDRYFQTQASLLSNIVGDVCKKLVHVLHQQQCIENLPHSIENGLSSTQGVDLIGPNRLDESDNQNPLAQSSILTQPSLNQQASIGLANGTGISTGNRGELHGRAVQRHHQHQQREQYIIGHNSAELSVLRDQCSVNVLDNENGINFDQHNDEKDFDDRNNNPNQEDYFEKMKQFKLPILHENSPYITSPAKLGLLPSQMAPVHYIINSKTQIKSNYTFKATTRYSSFEQASVLSDFLNPKIGSNNTDNSQNSPSSNLSDIIGQASSLVGIVKIVYNKVNQTVLVSDTLNNIHLFTLQSNPLPLLPTPEVNTSITTTEISTTIPSYYNSKYLSKELSKIDIEKARNNDKSQYPAQTTSQSQDSIYHTELTTLQSISRQYPTSPQLIRGSNTTRQTTTQFDITLPVTFGLGLTYQRNVNLNYERIEGKIQLGLENQAVFDAQKGQNVSSQGSGSQSSGPGIIGSQNLSQSSFSQGSNPGGSEFSKRSSSFHHNTAQGSKHGGGNKLGIGVVGQFAVGYNDGCQVIIAPQLHGGCGLLIQRMGSSGIE